MKELLYIIIMLMPASFLGAYFIPKTIEFMIDRYGDSDKLIQDTAFTAFVAIVCIMETIIVLLVTAILCLALLTIGGNQ